MKPGIKTIIVGVVLLVLGAFVIPLLFALPFILGKSHELQFKAPGGVEAIVNDPGRYYFWDDFRTVYEGKSYDQSENIPDGMVFLIRDAKGQELRFVSDTSMSTRIGSSAKRSIGYVEIESPGKFEIQVTGGNEEGIFSFSRPRLLRMFGLIAVGFGLSVLFGITGFVLLVLGIVKLARGNRLANKTL